MSRALLSLVLVFLTIDATAADRLKRKKKPDAPERVSDKLAIDGVRCSKNTAERIMSYCRRPGGDMVDTWGLKCLRERGHEVPLLLAREEDTLNALPCRPSGDEVLFGEPVVWCNPDILNRIVDRCAKGAYLDEWQLSCLRHFGVETPQYLYRHHPSKEPVFGCKLNPSELKEGVSLADLPILFTPVEQRSREIAGNH